MIQHSLSRNVLISGREGTYFSRFFFVVVVVRFYKSVGLVFMLMRKKPQILVITPTPCTGKQIPWSQVASCTLWVWHL